MRKTTKRYLHKRGRHRKEKEKYFCHRREKKPKRQICLFFYEQKQKILRKLGIFLYLRHVIKTPKGIQLTLTYMF
jgi:hypothetical protein